jgi:hypothetical protein
MSVEGRLAATDGDRMEWEKCSPRRTEYLAHSSILSRVGASTKSGAVHF